MSEKIEQIAKAISHHRKLENDIYARNPAFARFEAKYGDQISQFWITNYKNEGGYLKSTDITGAVVNTMSGNASTVINDGYVVYKNTRIGELFIRNYEGKFSHSTPKGEIEIELFNRAIYQPVYGSSAKEITIRFADEESIYQFNSLLEILDKTQELQQEIDELDQQLKQGKEVEELLKRRDAKKEEKRKLLEKAQSFIRRSAELRYQPILDPWQEEVKRSMIYQGTMAIDGGPGTGKTTSLIQRIKFLIDDSIEEYVEGLSKQQIQLLSDQKKSWIFFSPSELLSLYLRNTMVTEGLEANSDRVKVWKDHKRNLIRAYKLVNTETRRPFLFLNNSENHLIDSSPRQLKVVIDAFRKFFLDTQRSKLDKVLTLETGQFSWKNTGFSILKYVKDNIGDLENETLPRLYANLESLYKEEIQKINQDYKASIEKEVATLVLRVQKNAEQKDKLAVLLQDWKVKSNPEPEEDEEDLLTEQFGEEEDIDFNLEDELFLKIRVVLRKISLMNYDKSVKINKKDKQILELIPEINNVQTINKIGELAFFKKHFERICRGVSANILAEIPGIYKQFRKAQLAEAANGWNQTLLETLVANDSNQRIHPNEQALLLYFINTTLKSMAKSGLINETTERHPYYQGFQNHTKPVIGVDEASDFHAIDLLAMYSLSSHDLSSVTFAGDVMQRMTQEGINDWQELGQFIPDFDVKSLAVSYRQSPTLLDLATRIFKESTGNEPEYIPYLERDELEPAPLLFQSDDMDDKISWIAARIHEIYKAYGESIPSIAIFHPDKNELENFASTLAYHDELADYGIQVKASRTGEVLGDKNTVRVFSLEHIKGLEFEAVFFYDLDKINRLGVDQNLISRYLYVGLSRATFYLAATLEDGLPEGMNYLQEYFKMNQNWKR